MRTSFGAVCFLLIGTCFFVAQARQLAAASGSPEEREPRRQRHPDSTIVASAQGLYDAIERGEEHIVLEDHIDFSGFAERDVGNPGHTNGVLVVPSTIRSIRGNCSEPFPSAASLGLAGPALLPKRPGQCLLVFTGPGIVVQPLQERSNSIWLDSLYFREGSSRDRTDVSVQLLVGRWDVRSPDVTTGPQAWLTDLTFQGNGQRPVRGLYTTSRVYVERGVFSHLGYGEGPSAGIEPALVRGAGSTAAFSGCTFQHHAPASTSPVVAFADGPAAGLFEGCSFRNNTGRGDAAVRDVGRVYSDDATLEVFESRTRSFVVPFSAEDADEDLLEFLTLDDETFQGIQEEAGAEVRKAPESPEPPSNPKPSPQAPAGTSPEASPAAPNPGAGSGAQDSSSSAPGADANAANEEGSDDDGDGVNVVLVVMVALACFLALLATVPVVMVLVRRRRRAASTNKIGPDAPTLPTPLPYETVAPTNELPEGCSSECPRFLPNTAQLRSPASPQKTPTSQGSPADSPQHRADSQRNRFVPGPSAGPYGAPPATMGVWLTQPPMPFGPHMIGSPGHEQGSFPGFQPHQQHLNQAAAPQGAPVGPRGPAWQPVTQSPVLREAYSDVSEANATRGSTGTR